MILAVADVRLLVDSWSIAPSSTSQGALPPCSRDRTDLSGALTVCGHCFPFTKDVADIARRELDRPRRPKTESLVEQWNDSVKKSREQLRILVQFFTDMGHLTPMTDKVSDLFVRRMSLLNFCDLGESYLKWKFAHITCECFSQAEFPERPKWVLPYDNAGAILGGSYYRFTRVQAHNRSMEFGWNLSQLKKGMPLVSARAVASSVEKTVTGLTQPRDVSVQTAQWQVTDEDAAWDDLPDQRYSIENLIKQVTRTCREIYRFGWYKEQPLYTPSISGHIASKRKEGGAMGALVGHRMTIDEELVHTGNYRGPKVVRDNSRAAAIHAAAEIFTHCPHCPLTDLVPHSDGLSFCGTCGWHPYDSVIAIDATIEHTQILRDSLRFDADNVLSKRNVVEPVGLKEPFKVRVITGGPEGRYYRAKYIQKATHRRLRKLPNCALIGETISAERLDSVLHRPTDDEFYVSGDYSAATDNLDPRLSEAACREIGRTGEWTDGWIEEFVDALVRHRINHLDKRHLENYVTDADVEKYSSPQTWGQLMGSPASFVVLCLVNLALSRYALELRTGRRIKIKDSGILINGDDIGFVTDQPGYEIWKKVTSAGGLSPSLGKNFCSKDFIVLNSTMFLVQMRDGVRSLEYLPYINYGLLEGRNENGTPIAQDPDALVPSGDPRTPGIGSLARDLVKGHPEDRAVNLLKRFVKSWKGALDKFCPRGMSYYLPEHLGGLGLPIIGEFHSNTHADRFSRSQRVLASFLDHDHEKSDLLLSTARIGRSDSLSLWKSCSSRVRRLTRHLGARWVKESEWNERSDISCITTPLLVDAYTRLGEEDLQANAAESELSAAAKQTRRFERYNEWKNSYEQLFSLAERSTYAPMSDPDITQSTPWRAIYPDFIVVDNAPRVDLRINADEISSVSWNQYRTVSRILDEDTDDEAYWDEYANHLDQEGF